MPQERVSQHRGRMAFAHFTIRNSSGYVNPDHPIGWGFLNKNRQFIPNLISPRWLCPRFALGSPNETITSRCRLKNFSGLWTEMECFAPSTAAIAAEFIVPFGTSLVVFCDEDETRLSLPPAFTREWIRADAPPEKCEHRYSPKWPRRYGEGGQRRWGKF